MMHQFNFTEMKFNDTKDGEKEDIGNQNTKPL